jgi:hypothetical protein
MEGRARAAQHEYEIALTQAWHGEVFARQKKLKRLSEYLPSENSNAVQPEAILDAMLTMQAHGVPMTVRRVT